MRHLRALCAIADLGSVRKAALHLGMTQPSLTTQLRRIERAVGGRLFTRGQSGSRPTPLGRSVLCRARPIVAEMDALVAEVRGAALHQGSDRLRIGSTGSRVVAGWLSRLHDRYPDTDTTIHIDVSAPALLDMVAARQLEAAFVSEPEGFPLRRVEGVEQRVLVAREPQFVALSASHPAAERSIVDLDDLVDDQWMVDLTVDDEWAALRRSLTVAGLNPRVVHVPDITTAAELIASGEAVSLCQPTSIPREGMVIRPLRDDPLTVRLLLIFAAGSITAEESEAVYGDLRASYLEAAEASEVYRRWLRRHGDPLAAPVPPQPSGPRLVGPAEYPDAEGGGPVASRPVPAPAVRPVVARPEPVERHSGREREAGPERSPNVDRPAPSPSGAEPVPGRQRGRGAGRVREAAVAQSSRTHPGRPVSPAEDSGVRGTTGRAAAELG